MATATFSFTINNLVPLGDATQKCVRYFGTITFNAPGNTYATGGLLPTAGAALLNLGPFGDRTPLEVYIESQAGAAYYYLWNQSTGKLQIFSSATGSGTSALVELTNGTALNATTPSIAADVINFEAVFPRR